jgi:hypothetical protein
MRNFGCGIDSSLHIEPISPHFRDVIFSGEIPQFRNPL